MPATSEIFLDEAMEASFGWLGPRPDGASDHASTPMIDHGAPPLSAFRHKSTATMRAQGARSTLAILKGLSTNPLRASSTEYATWTTPSTIAAHPRGLGYSWPSAIASPNKSRAIPPVSVQTLLVPISMWRTASAMRSAFAWSARGALTHCWAVNLFAMSTAWLTPYTPSAATATMIPRRARAGLTLSLVTAMERYRAKKPTSKKMSATNWTRWTSSQTSLAAYSGNVAWRSFGWAPPPWKT